MANIKQPSRPLTDWSTSYQAGSSRYFVVLFLFIGAYFDLHGSSESGESSSDDEHNNVNGPWTASPRVLHHDTTITARRESFTTSNSSRPTNIRRSRSPAIKKLDGNSAAPAKRNSSPSRHKTHYASIPPRSLLPSTFCISFPLPYGRYVHKVSGDFRKAGENIILLSSSLFSAKKICTEGHFRGNWLAIGKFVISFSLRSKQIRLWISAGHLFVTLSFSNPRFTDTRFIRTVYFSGCFNIVSYMDSSFVLRDAKTDSFFIRWSTKALKTQISLFFATR